MSSISNLPKRRAAKLGCVVLGNVYCVVLMAFGYSWHEIVWIGSRNGVHAKGVHAKGVHANGVHDSGSERGKLR